MGIVILLVMAAGVALMLTRTLPTAFVLVLLAMVIALLSGATLLGDTNSVTTTVLAKGSVRLADTMAAIVIGSWLATVMAETGIGSTLIRKTVELGGDRPYVVALGVFVIAVLVGTVTSSAPAAMLVGVIGIPTMISMGVPPVTAAGTVGMGLAVGVPFELINWQYLAQVVDVPISVVKDFQIKFFPIALFFGIAYVLIESRRRGLRHNWAATATVESAAKRQRTDAPWYALLTPFVPIVLALVMDVPIIPSLLAGVCYALLTATPIKKFASVGLRTLHRSFEVAVPPLLLFAAIGMLLAAVTLPGAVKALSPIVTAIAPASPWLFVLIFGALVPLALYRGPFAVFGMGAGLAGVLVSTGTYPAPAVLGMMASYNQTAGVSDPTATQAVWCASFAGVQVEQLMLRTLPYVWLTTVGGLILTAVRYL